MPKSPKVRRESNKREREDGWTSEAGTNLFRKSSRTGRSQVETKKKIKVRKWIMR
jgi:hypothetical protein